MPQDRCEISCKHPQAIADVQEVMPEGGVFLHVAEIFKALGDPTRAKILFSLSVQELCVCDLAALVCMSSSAVSHQLRLLRAGRLVTFRKEGKIVYYSLADEHVRDLLKQAMNHAVETGGE